MYKQLLVKSLLKLMNIKIKKQYQTKTGPHINLTYNFRKHVKNIWKIL